MTSSLQPDRDDRAKRRELAICWHKAQPVVAAYIASAVRDHQHAEDMLQETALSVAETFDQYDPDRPFLAWAIGIAKHKLYHYYRKQSRDRLVFDEDLLSQIGARFEDQAEALRDRNAALKTCMDRLAKHARDMIQMRYMDAMGYEQIAKAMGRSTAGVANGLSRARKFLAECVKREFKNSPGVAHD